ncbi:DUF6364 family protein [Dyadobacter sp. CY356]|uniref:DUF6364 family protein n=1 Tax=Dyadobacter sp. CY356 TaxID=2906442 RepID=UPI001F1B39F6|nr:DUF6364 family protein [Dyadobacter sp. CY356]MCF0057259.1 DUF6364 family protein [Dyadobacter sp. CY356]
MNTKLTLTIEDSVIDQAKKYARQEGRSLSDLVENYLKAVIADSKEKPTELTPIVKALKGSFKAPADFDYKEELIKGLSEKYL